MDSVLDSYLWLRCLSRRCFLVFFFLLIFFVTGFLRYDALARYDPSSRYDPTSRYDFPLILLLLLDILSFSLQCLPLFTFCLYVRSTSACIYLPHLSSPHVSRWKNTSPVPQSHRVQVSAMP